LNHVTAPGLPVYEAVRMSMGVPFVWPEVKWGKKEWERWGKYRGTSKERLIVDGGVLSNFPLRFLLKPGKLLGPLDPPQGVAEKDVLSVGLFLDNTLPEAPQKGSKLSWYEYLPAFRTASLVLDTMMDSLDQDALRELSDEKRSQVVCRIGVN